jgi:NADPH2 dehydrogenase
MDEAEIERVIGLFASAAARADRCGFDAIEIHGAHGYLISQFLSPMANRRTDRYGGSLDNRMRFGRRVAEAVRAIWPRGKAVGFRLNATDWIEGGITLDETVEFSSVLHEIGIDFVTISSGGNSRAQKLPPHIPSYQVGFAEEVKRRVGITTMAIGMILTPKQANDIVKEKQADLIGVARATLDDPRWALHAAQALGDEPQYPESYWRLSRKHWPGYDIVHGAT